MKYIHNSHISCLDGEGGGRRFSSPLESAVGERVVCQQISGRIARGEQVDRQRNWSTCDADEPDPTLG